MAKASDEASNAAMPLESWNGCRCLRWCQPLAEPSECVCCVCAEPSLSSIHPIWSLLFLRSVGVAHHDAFDEGCVWFGLHITYCIPNNIR